MCQSSIQEASSGLPHRPMSRRNPGVSPLSDPSVFLSLLLLGPILLPGCTDSPTAGPTGSFDDTPVSGLVVSPAGASLSGAGSTLQLLAEGATAEGDAVPNPLVSWSSLNPLVATVDPTTGQVTAVANGQATMMAEGVGATAYSLVTVSVPELGPVSGWSFDNEPRPWLTSIWGSSASNVFVVGSSGALYHFDGMNWAEVDTGLDAQLMDVWGTSSADIFVVGRNGTILHFDGMEWIPMEHGISESLAGVWGSSAQDVFVVGESGGIFHFDGASWSDISPGENCRFSDVRGSSATDIFVAGCAGTVLHFDGTAWTGGRREIDVSRLDEFWVAAEDDVYLVGWGMWHFDGTAWTNLGSPYGSLRSVWGAPSGEIFTVGDEGTILRYYDATWTAMESGTEKTLEGVWGTSADNVFAVGEGNTILHFDGISWSTVRTGVSERFHEIWGATPGDVYAASSHSPVYHFNGSGWSAIDDPDFVGGVDGIWGTSSSDIFVIGAGIGKVVQHYDGSTWDWTDLGYNSARAIWGGSPVDVFAVGGGIYMGGEGIIHRYDGVEWTEIARIDGRGFTGIWGSSISNIYAVGEMGAIFHFDGADWAGMNSGTEAWLGSVWGLSPTSVFAVGSGGTILHYDGATWTRMDSGTEEGLIAVAGTSPTDVYAGGGGVLLHFDGEGWSPIAEAEMSVTGASVWGIWIDSIGDVIVVGVSGMILRGVR